MNNLTLWGKIALYIGALDKKDYKCRILHPFTLTTILGLTFIWPFVCMFTEYRIQDFIKNTDLNWSKWW